MRQQQQLQPRACPRRCFLVQVEEMLQDSQKFPVRLSLRLMGVAVSFLHESSLLFIDDGTAVVSLNISEMDRLQETLVVSSSNSSGNGCGSANTVLGRTLDCIVRITSDRTLSAEQVFIVTDPNTETLRYFEILSQHNKNTPSTADNAESWMGYPTRRRVQSTDLFEIIESDAKNCINKGSALEDLANLFGLDQNTAEQMVQELQMSGQVYRNEDGLFQPL